MRRILAILALLTLLPVAASLVWGAWTGDAFSWTSLPALPRMVEGITGAEIPADRDSAGDGNILPALPPEASRALLRARDLPPARAARFLAARVHDLELGDAALAPARPVLALAAMERALEAGLHDEALRLSRDAALAESHLGGEARRLAGRVHEARDEFEAAARAYGAAARLGRGTSLEPEALLRQADLLLEAGRGTEALDVVERLEPFAPEFLEEDGILYRRALAYRATGRITTAHATLDSLWFRHPTSPYNKKAKALAWRRGRDLTKRGAAVPRADRLARAEALFAARWYTTALQEYQVLLEAYPHAEDTALLHLRAGICARHRKRWSTAAHHLDRVPPTRPDLYVEALYEKGRMDRSRRRGTSFLQTMERVAELDGTGLWRARALHQMGEYLRERDPVRARTLYVEAAAAAPSTPEGSEARWRLGWMDYHGYDFESARNHFLRLAAEGHHPHERAAGLYWAAKSEGGRGQEAPRRSLLEQVAREYPNDFYGTRARQLLGMPVDGSPVSLTPAGHREPFEEHLLAELRGALARTAAAVEDRQAARRLADLLAAGLLDAAQRELDALRRAWDDPPELRGLQLDLHGLRGDHLAALRAFRETYPEFRSRLDIPEAHWRAVYPRGFLDLVHRESQVNGLDPDFVLAVIHQESVFDAEATSWAGARGLMQIMPATGRSLARRLGDRDFATRRLFEPERNVRYGTFYLRDLLDRFEGRPELALAGYNAGGGRVTRWLREPGTQDLDVFVESIPFDETRNYVKRILNNVALYKRIYGAAGAAPESAPALTRLTLSHGSEERAR